MGLLINVNLKTISHNMGVFNLVIHLNIYYNYKKGNKAELITINIS